MRPKRGVWNRSDRNFIGRATYASRKNQETENIVENTANSYEDSFSQEESDSLEKNQETTNDLKEFGVDVDEPDLFNTENQELTSENLLGSSEEENEEDDLEIPAFLRRQKN